MKVTTDEQKIEDLLTRGVEDVFVIDSLRKKLKSGKQLRVKLGIDPTGPKIHIGRASVLRKLKAFQDLGHKVILIVGDFTAQIGDPSDKTEKRPMLTKDKIKENLKDYKKQIGKIINISKTEFQFNSKWLGKLGFQEIAQLAESFSIQQMLARRNFKNRIEKGEEVSLRESLYPLMQGYDSVAIDADVEIGGFDQLFNLKAGRVIQRHYNKPEQDVLTVKMLEGTDGRKMSTSWENVITIVDEPKDMYGKIMSVKDELMYNYFVLGTDLPMNEIESIKKSLDLGKNPRDAKMYLARQMVSLYHGEKKAREAEENFINTFQKKEIPKDIEEVKGEGKSINVLVASGVAKSVSEARRLFDAGAVTDMVDNKKLTQEDRFEAGHVYKIGKHRFIKIKLN